MSNEVKQEGAANHDARGKLGLGTATKDFIAGGVAGALSIAITQPLDTVRVNLQQNSTGSATTTAAFSGNSAILRKANGGVTREIAHLLQEGGVRALWKGLTMPLAFASLQNAILFQVCGSVLRSQSEAERLRDDKNRSIPTVSQAAAAGCVAGLAQVFLWSPVELIKLRLQLQRDASPSRQVVAGGRAAWTPGPAAAGSLGMLRQVMQHEGLRGLYRGFTVSMLRDVPSYGIYFATYYHVCTQIEQLKQGTNVHPENASPSTQLLAGGLSGTFGWMSVYYLDVVKSRMQAETAQQSPGKTWLGYARQVYQGSGLKGFVRGLQPTLVRAFVMDAVAFYGYSSTLHLLD